MKKTRAIRVAGSAFVSVFFCLEGGCVGGNRPPASSGASPSPSSSLLSAYEAARATAWDSKRRFKALFKAEISPKIGPVGRGYFSVWWDGAAATLEWRSSAPIGGNGRGGFLRRAREAGRVGDDGASLLPGKLASEDALACILGVPEAQLPSPPRFKENPKAIRVFFDDSKRSVLVDAQGHVTEMVFPNGETVTLQPGEGVPRRIDAKGSGGHAVLTLESYSSWSEDEPVPPL